MTIYFGSLRIRHETIWTRHFNLLARRGRLLERNRAYVVRHPGIYSDCSIRKRMAYKYSNHGRLERGKAVYEVSVSPGRKSWYKGFKSFGEAKAFALEKINPTVTAE